MNTYYIYAILAIISLISIIAFRIYRRIPKHHAMDDMEGREFENYCASFLLSEGFIDVRLTPDSHDYGVDILAEKDGVTYAVQCKRYDHPVGLSAVQQAYSGKDFYDCMVGIVMTNQYFTAPAVNMAKKLKIMLWDRDYISSPSE